MISSLVVFLGGVTAAWVVTGTLLPLLRSRVMDVPNDRSSHSVPTPRGGGLAIVFVVAVVAAWGAVSHSLDERAAVVVFGALTMAGVGFADDFFGGLRIRSRLAIELIVAAIVVAIAGPLSTLPLPPPVDVDLPAWAGWVVTLLWVLGVTNIFNFLDGIDGFAGLQGVIAGVALGWVLGTGTELSVIAVSAAGGSLGFLAYNWHPARVFMGDVGSLFLGFLFAALPLAVPPKDVGSAVFVAGMAMWFFLADGAFTLVRRLVRGERIWEAHQSHLYQRLVHGGWTHSRVALVVMGGGAFVAVMAGISVSNAGSLGQWSALTAAFLFFVGYLLMVRTMRRGKS